MNRDAVTLRQAHELLNREWPGQDASGSAWVAHHERAAALYARVARSDPDHYHEALYWAGYEREQAESRRQLVTGVGDGGGSDGSA